MKGSPSARMLPQQQTVDSIQRLLQWQEIHLRNQNLMDLNSTRLKVWTTRDPPQKQENLMDLNRSQRSQVRNKFESLQLTKRPTANHTELNFVEDWSPPETKMLPRQQKLTASMEIQVATSKKLTTTMSNPRMSQQQELIASTEIQVLPQQQRPTASISKNRYQFNGDSTVSIRPTKDPRATV